MAVDDTEGKKKEEQKVKKRTKQQEKDKSMKTDTSNDNTNNNVTNLGDDVGGNNNAIKSLKNKKVGGKISQMRTHPTAFASQSI